MEGEPVRSLDYGGHPGGTRLLKGGHWLDDNLRVDLAAFLVIGRQFYTPCRGETRLRNASRQWPQANTRNKTKPK